ncbi:MAG: DUF5329 family protein [Candidatus Omnitrophica bacterium]|nr:DUF5329 family protein [Candidatus Omnitrophota bacterium]
MRISLGVLIIGLSFIFASWGDAQTPIPLLSKESSSGAVYQRYLKDHDKKHNEINYLLNLIENSSLSFERNGQKANGKVAAYILRFKFNQEKKNIYTTEDFIARVASFSSHTNKSYYVILLSGKKLLLKDQLYAELDKLRNQWNKKFKNL